MRKILLATAALACVAAPAAAKDTVVIYTALEPEQITDYMKAVNKTLHRVPPSPTLETTDEELWKR